MGDLLGSLIKTPYCLKGRVQWLNREQHQWLESVRGSAGGAGLTITPSSSHLNFSPFHIQGCRNLTFLLANVHPHRLFREYLSLHLNLSPFHIWKMQDPIQYIWVNTFSIRYIRVGSVFKSNILIRPYFLSINSQPSILNSLCPTLSNDIISKSLLFSQYFGFPIAGHLPLYCYNRSTLNVITLLNLKAIALKRPYLFREYLFLHLKLLIFYSQVMKDWTLVTYQCYALVMSLGFTNVNRSCNGFMQRI